MTLACPTDRLGARSATLASLVFALASATLVAGCARPYADFCKNVAQCSGGNDADIDACQATYSASEAVAAAYDCADAFDKAWDCMERTGTCKNSSYSTDCSTEKAAVATCQSAASARGKGAQTDGTDNGNGNGNGAPQTSCGLAYTCGPNNLKVSQCLTTDGSGKCTGATVQVEGGETLTCASCSSCSNVAAQVAAACGGSAGGTGGGETPAPTPEP
jgi:hypothetical protein